METFVNTYRYKEILCFVKRRRNNATEKSRTEEFQNLPKNARKTRKRKCDYSQGIDNKLNSYFFSLKKKNIGTISC